MTRVIANMSMSLDGFVSHPTDGCDTLFKWYGAGDVAVGTADDDFVFHVDESSAEKLREATQAVGALIYGRVTFDTAQGWDGHHPIGAPVYVVTHSVPEGWPRPGAAIHFVTEGGVEAAVAQAKEAAGEDKIVAVGSATIASQCLNLGLLDEVQIDLVPAMLGEGTRFFENLEGTPYELGQPMVVPGQGVTHLAYPVLKH
jgi:dihydrofolate reductase